MLFLLPQVITRLTMTVICLFLPVLGIWSTILILGKFLFENSEQIEDEDEVQGEPEEPVDWMANFDVDDFEVEDVSDNDSDAESDADSDEDSDDYSDPGYDSEYDLLGDELLISDEETDEGEHEFEEINEELNEEAEEADAAPEVVGPSAEPSGVEWLPGFNPTQPDDEESGFGTVPDEQTSNSPISESCCIKYRQNNLSSHSSLPLETFPVARHLKPGGIS